MNSTFARTEDGTLQLTITIPAADVKKASSTVVDQTVDNAKVPGFRKGKAPKKLVEEATSTEALKEETLKKLLPEAYIQAITEHKLRPIVNPKIHVQKLDDGGDWVFTAETCEMPEVTLGEYKKAVKDVTAKSKIIVPGKEQETVNVDDILMPIVQKASVAIPKILVEFEVDRLLSQTLDEIKSLGLTLEQYLGSTNKTPEKLREDFAEKAQNDIKVEFVLAKIAETEKITVEEKEVEEAIHTAKTDAERANLEQNRHLLSSIIRQQKTLDFLRNL
ncbi:MAG: hypothetical protein KBC15_04350 [Candidatus Levybacteria bacterium]|nr:hypothetical protein [Candidatus Levybacteria bacterium]